jgi:adenylate cyclase
VLESINLVEQGQAPLYEPATFRGKAVLVGIHADAYEDHHQTPLDDRFPGVELHATALDNLLRGDGLAAPAWDLPLVVVAAAVAVATVFVLPGTMAPLAALLLLLGAALGGVLWAWTALVAVPVAAPALAAGCASGGAFLHRLVVEGRQRRTMHRAFRSYLAPEVLREVLRAGDSLRLGGEVRDVTLLFTDLEGFTSLSERLQPHELVAFMNDYFTRMCAPVLAERGVIDKFIGDAIMAFFGAPIAEPDHGARAVRSALAAARVSAAIAGELTARGLPRVATRIGVHRGQAVIGNMGSAQRFDYTAIGDTVNLAARLEGANKAFGTTCLVSETAWAQCEGTVLGREVGHVHVVGRVAPIAVWTPLVELDRATADDHTFVADWQRGVAALRAGDRAAARTAFAACAASRPDDRLTATWLDRLADPDFRGEFRLDSK